MRIFRYHTISRMIIYFARNYLLLDQSKTLNSHQPPPTTTFCQFLDSNEVNTILVLATTKKYYTKTQTPPPAPLAIWGNIKGVNYSSLPYLLHVQSLSHYCFMITAQLLPSSPQTDPQTIQCFMSHSSYPIVTA
jgi:hypothetical protein